MKIPHKLTALQPCGDALAWLERCKARSAQGAWNKCARGDWMLWLVSKLAGPPESAKRKKLILALCGCARLALKYVKAGENRPLVCIETAESWADGKATIEQVREARWNVYAAAYTSAAASAASAAVYATAAAYAASAAASAAAADYAADAADADAADASAADASAAAARKKMLKDCADVVRKFYPKAPRL